MLIAETFKGINRVHGIALLGRKVTIPNGKNEQTYPVKALQVWIPAAKLTEGPLFRPVSRHGAVKPCQLSAQPSRSSQALRSSR